ncbi:hypothetical protein BS78_01G320200 [Paspalum vaginatum]|nr:hypothetical protein BS78_01G320200 [Paspalum vaginatum]
MAGLPNVYAAERPGCLLGQTQASRAPLPPAAMLPSSSAFPRAPLSLSGDPLSLSGDLHSPSPGSPLFLPGDPDASAARRSQPEPRPLPARRPCAHPGLPPPAAGATCRGCPAPCPTATHALTASAPLLPLHPSSSWCEAAVARSYGVAADEAATGVEE